jgi:ribosomal protein L11 methyltransferase
MNLFEVKAEVPFETVDEVDEQLLERGDTRWSVFQDVDQHRAWVVGIFDEACAAQLAWEAVRTVLPARVEAVIRPMAPEDWRNSYKAHFKAWRCGPLHWVPVWERESHRLRPGEVAVWLDPGLAFGTGNHETTRLCCERLVAWAETHPRTARVVDAGCGSGILALSAGRLGFTNVRGFDNDPEAVRVSRENAELNGLGDGVRFETADLVSGLAGEQADLLLANIQADVLGRFGGELLTAVAPGGTLAMSGILARECGSVRDRFSAAAPDWRVESRVLGEWADLAITRP